MNRHSSATEPFRAAATVETGGRAGTTAADGVPTLTELRARIEAIERARPTLVDRTSECEISSSGAPASPRGRPLSDRGDGGGGASPQDAHARAPTCHLPAPPFAAFRRRLPPWRLGAREIDGLLPAAGLEDDALHEIKPVLPAPGQAAAAATTAARQLALALAGRRLATLSDSADPRMAGAPVLWCAPAATAADSGRPYGQGLMAFGVDPGRLLMADAPTVADALWVLEEGLASGSLALAIGLVDEIDLTPARRLSLAAAAKRTPCLLITGARSAPAGATATRWRVGPAPGAEHPFDTAAPGDVRFEIALERCRRAPQAATLTAVSLEWCDEAYRFRMAAGVADRAMAPSGPGRQRRLGAAG